MRCLEKDPDKRFQTAKELEDILVELKGADPTSLVLNLVHPKEEAIIAPEPTFNMWMSEANQTTPLNNF